MTPCSTERATLVSYLYRAQHTHKFRAGVLLYHTLHMNIQLLDSFSPEENSSRSPSPPPPHKKPERFGESLRNK